MASPDNSILQTIKKALGIEPSVDVFDDVLIMHINSVFSTLQQIGVGPSEGYEIESPNNTWSEFVTDKTFNSVKTYVYIQVRLRFDPPATAHAETALKDLAKEAEWRLNVHAESPTKG